MAKYQLKMAIKRGGKRVPYGTVLTDLKRDEVAELKALGAIAFVPPTEAEEADDAAPGGDQGNDKGKGGKAA